MNEFDTKVVESMGKPLQSEDIRTVQVNIGLKCNLACRHCHLESSPEREEMMSREILVQVLETIGSLDRCFVDITGGAPELHPDLRWFIIALENDGHSIQVRTNLVAPDPSDGTSMLKFYRDHRVQLVASLPCYLKENVDSQRGKGSYQRIIKSIRILNSLGYGIEDDLVLNLVYNPGGAHLPPDQATLESDYRRELNERFGIRFTHLHTITNIPMGRFREYLQQAGQEDSYMNLLQNAFNPATMNDLMCRHQVCVGWDGTLYDCDFNLAQNVPVNHGAPDHIRDFDFGTLEHRQIVTGDYCFGCTAGSGSSCGGALV